MKNIEKYQKISKKIVWKYLLLIYKEIVYNVMYQQENEHERSSYSFSPDTLVRKTESTKKARIISPFW